MTDDWQLLAMAAIGDDTSPRGIARFGETGVDRAEEVYNAARAAGVLDERGSLDRVQRARLIAELPSYLQARVHTRAASGLLAEGPDRLDDAARHLRAAASLVDPEPAIELADSAGRLSLSLGDYASASTLLALAADYDTSTDLSRQGHRLCDLAAALDGLGDLESAHGHAARAVALGELANDPGLVARAAIAHTFPVDWNAGNPRTHGLLERATRMSLERNDRIAVTAARAMAEMRIPVIAGELHQVAWVTRPGVAQPLADAALAEADTCPLWVRCLASLAWRSTHRAPDFLEKRREQSLRALEVAQTIRHPSFQVESAIWLAVDALESADRVLFEEALSVTQWVAQHDGNPRLKFRANSLALGAALLDGDYDRARTLLDATCAIVARMDSSLLLVVQTLFGGQLVISEDDPAALAALCPDPASKILTHPLGRSGAAYLWARSGQVDLAVEQTRRALVQRDPESSLLLVGTRAAAVAYETGDESLCRDTLDLLTPYSDLVAVDSNGWWCDGPVAVWVAMLHHRLGQDLAAHHHLAIGEQLARGLRDARSLRRIEQLRLRLPTVGHTTLTGTEQLTPRERSVLQRLASGATNGEIARDLAFSVSTIRNDTMAIYRKLGAHGRPEAVATALSLGLITLEN